MSYHNSVTSQKTWNFRSMIVQIIASWRQQNENRSFMAGYIVSLGKQFPTFWRIIECSHFQGQTVEEKVATHLWPFDPEEGGNTSFRNVRKFLPNKAAWNPRTVVSSATPLWEHHSSHLPAYYYSTLCEIICILFVYLYDTLMKVAEATETCRWIVMRNKTNFGDDHLLVFFYTV